MAAQYNDQNLVRAIRKAVEQFLNADDGDIDAKLRAIMSVASLSALATISNRQMGVSTMTYIEGRLK